MINTHCTWLYIGKCVFSCAHVVQQQVYLQPYTFESHLTEQKSSHHPIKEICYKQLLSERQKQLTNLA